MTPATGPPRQFRMELAALLTVPSLSGMGAILISLWASQSETVGTVLFLIGLMSVPGSAALFWYAIWASVRGHVSWAVSRQSAALLWLLVAVSWVGAAIFLLYFVDPFGV